MEKRYISLILFAVIFVSIIFSSCSLSYDNVYKKEIYALDTVIDFTVYSNEDTAKKAVELAVDEINRLEDEFSITGSGDISEINSSDGMSTQVKKETADLIAKSMDIGKKTKGLFDISIYPVMHLWGFDTGEYHVPQNDEISEALKYVDYKNIKVDDTVITLKKGMKIDLGGIAKGYITQRTVDILIKNGIDSAIVNSGGNVFALGKKPDKAPFVVGIQDPFDESSYFAKLELENEYAISSGTYQRYFEHDGVKYHHIMSPKTGRPVENDISSVTVIGKDGALCDAYSTSLFIMGLEDSIDFYRLNEGFDFVILTYDNELYVTQELSDRLKISDGYSIKVNTVYRKAK